MDGGREGWMEGGREGGREGGTHRLIDTQTEPDRHPEG